MTTSTSLKPIIRRIIKEHLQVVDLVENQNEQEFALTTYGDLKKILSRDRKSQMTKAAGKGILKALFELIPGVSTASSGLEILTALYYNKQNKKTNTRLDKITIDPYVAQIVDDTIERAFLNKLYSWVMKKPDDEELGKYFDMDVLLNKYLSQNYRGRRTEIP